MAVFCQGGCFFWSAIFHHCCLDVSFCFQFNINCRKKTAKNAGIQICNKLENHRWRHYERFFYNDKTRRIYYVICNCCGFSKTVSNKKRPDTLPLYRTIGNYQRNPSDFRGCIALSCQISDRHFIVSFGGISGLFQTASMLRQLSFSLRHYACFKLACAILATGFLELVCRLYAI